MSAANSGLIVWDVDGTLIPADLRWLRRAIARTYDLPEEAVAFPAARVHGYTDESIVVGAAVASGVSEQAAEAGVSRFYDELAAVMSAGEAELKRDQPAYPGAVETIAALNERGFVQTVLTGNLRLAAEFKLRVAGLLSHLDLDIGAYGSDARERFDLPAVVCARFEARYGRGVDVGRTVVIGDAPNDIACARHAGFGVIVVTHRIGHDELARYDPDAIVGSLEPDIVVSALDSVLRG